MLATALELVKNHGPKKLLSGAGATFTGYFLHGAFKYGLFEAGGLDEKSIIPRVMTTGSPKLVQAEMVCMR